MSLLASEAFVRLLDKRLDKVYWKEYNGLESIVEKFFDRKRDSKAWSEYYHIGSVPDPARFLGTVTYPDVYPGYHFKIEPLAYAGGIMIERELLDTEQYGIIDQMAGGLGEAAKTG